MYSAHRYEGAYWVCAVDWYKGEYRTGNFIDISVKLSEILVIVASAVPKAITNYRNKK